jgi:hypothetical protein
MNKSFQWFSIDLRIITKCFIWVYKALQSLTLSTFPVSSYFTLPLSFSYIGQFLLLCSSINLECPSLNSFPTLHIHPNIHLVILYSSFESWLKCLCHSYSTPASYSRSASFTVCFQIIMFFSLRILISVCDYIIIIVSVII